MRHCRPLIASALACCTLFASTVVARDDVEFERASDVLYGRKYGMALTMDVFTPKEKANGLGLIWVVSGGWFSSHGAISEVFVKPFLERGYTVFAVVHGSQPKFTITEILPDMHRAVRFIRHNADQYAIDPERIGIFGASAGGHLSLMQGLAGEEGDATASDPVDRATSRVQAVAGFFPPTDFLNYGKPGNVALGRGVLKDFRAPFDFHELDAATNHYVPITDDDALLEIGKTISPVYHVDADDPPTLLIHGDADTLVPIQQSELIMKAFEKEGLTARLIVKPNASHGWPDLLDDLQKFADWFDTHLGPSDDGDKPAEASVDSDS